MLLTQITQLVPQKETQRDFKLMFPNCPTAQSYAPTDAKVKYNVPVGIAPYCKEQLM